MKKICIFLITFFIVGCTDGSSIVYSNLDIFSECRDIKPIEDGKYIICADLNKDCIERLNKCKSEVSYCAHIKLLSNKKNKTDIVIYNEDERKYNSQHSSINYLAKYPLEGNNNIYLYSFEGGEKESDKFIYPFFIKKGIIQFGAFYLNKRKEPNNSKKLKSFIENNIDEKIVTSYDDNNKAIYKLTIEKEESIKKIALFQSKNTKIFYYMIPIDIEKPSPEVIDF
jgi:hypothetical protein